MQALARNFLNTVDYELHLCVEVRCRYADGVEVTAPPTINRVRRHARECRRLRPLLLCLLAQFIGRVSVVRGLAIGLFALMLRGLAGLSSDNLLDHSEGRVARLRDLLLEFLLGQITQCSGLVREVFVDALGFEGRNRNRVFR